MDVDKNNYWNREKECEQLFLDNGPYYYITTENLDRALYKSREEFMMGTNMVAIASARSGMDVLDDVEMTNHHHIMGRGDISRVQGFVDFLRDSQRKLQRSLGNPPLKDWNIQIEETVDLKQFRNRICYTDRNAYVARFDAMPTGYPWGSANLFFNGNLWLFDKGIEYPKVGGREKRIICRSHNVDLPEHYRVLDGMILRSSFVKYRITESLFNNANQYFSLLTRRGEADIEIARILGENIQIPIEETFQIVASWFPGKGIRQMTQYERLEAAKMMKTRLNSSNRIISIVLQLPASTVNSMFPAPK
ncbi:MAG: hypothetical protein IK052_06430 [Bacteroidales bacterium]|nr:hypothetical protein [Bacteroidales bacterium]